MAEAAHTAPPLSRAHARHGVLVALSGSPEEQRALLVQLDDALAEAVDHPQTAVRVAAAQAVIALDLFGEDHPEARAELERFLSVRAHYAAQRPQKLPRNEGPRCGARTRGGTPCQAKPVWDSRGGRPRNGRCRLHGGLSTGPRRKA